jgi:outer membrane protein
MQKLLIGSNVFLLLAVAYLFISRPSGVAESIEHHNKNKTSEADSTAFVSEGRIAYINVDSLNLQYKFLSDKKDHLMKEEKNLEIKLKGKMTKAQARFEELNQKAYSMTESQLAAAQEELEQLQESIENYQQQLTDDLLTLESSLQNELNTRISDHLKKYNEEYGYDYILGFQVGGQVLYGNEALDITRAVIEGLNEEYARQIATSKK